MLAIGGVAVIGAVAIGIALAAGGGDEAPDARAALEAAGCTLNASPALRGVHSIVTPGGTSKDWKTDPPTSGPHYEVPAVWGTYDDPVNQGQLVHNLEHGGIAVQYGTAVPPATVAELKAFVQENSRGTVLAPYAKLGKLISLGAWVVADPEDSSDLGTAYLAKCPGFDQAAFDAFFDAYQFRGPERFPSEMLLPGRT